MFEKLFGPKHTFKDALLTLEKGLRTGEITLHGEADAPPATADLSSEHGMDTAAPKAGSRSFRIIIEGASINDLIKVWSELCKPTTEPTPEFKAIYPFLTTVRGNRFQFRCGDQEDMKANLQKLFEANLKKPLGVKVET